MSHVLLWKRGFIWAEKSVFYCKKGVYLGLKSQVFYRKKGVVLSWKVSVLPQKRASFSNWRTRMGITFSSEWGSRGWHSHISHITMGRNAINFLYNPSHMTLWCLEVVLVVYARMAMRYVSSLVRSPGPSVVLCIVNSYGTLLNWPIDSLLFLFLFFSMFFVLIHDYTLCFTGSP